MKKLFISILPLLCAFFLTTGISHAARPAQKPPAAQTASILIPVKALTEINSAEINPAKTLAGHSEAVMSVSFSPDGKTLASGGYDKSVILWDIATGAKLKTLEGHSAFVYSVSFSPDGKTLASGGYDKSVILWDIATGAKLKTLVDHSNVNVVYSVSFSPDGKTLASGSHKSVSLWDIATGAKLKTLEGHSAFVYSVSFSPDGKTLASGSTDKSVILWNTATGARLKTLEDHSIQVASVSFSPDGKTLASGSFNHGVILWDIATGAKLKTLTGAGHFNQVNSVSFSPDGKTLASGNYDKSVSLWDVATMDIAELVNIKKDEFETTQEFEARTAGVEAPYSSPISLGKYDADRGGFEAELKGNKLFIPVSKAKARDISGKKNSLRIKGKLKYYDPENLSLVEAIVIDPATNESFALYAMTGGAATASAPKPAVAKPAAQIAYAPLPAVVKKPVSDVAVAPNFNASTRPNDFAIVIGIENYQTIPKSEFSRSDADVVKGYLKAMGFPERNIELLTDDRATYSAIKKTVETWLPNRVKKESRVFVYYSGHGAPEPDTGEAYIVPFDGDPSYLPDTAYPIKRLYEKLGGLKAVEVIVALDSCFSGAGGRSVLAKGARPLVITADTGRQPANMAVLTATSGAQISTSSPERGHGLFTYFFLRALQDGKTTAADIYEYMKPQVEDEAKLLNVKQSPSISPAPERIKGRFNLK